MTFYNFFYQKQIYGKIWELLYEPKQLINFDNIAKINEWIDNITLLHLNLSVNNKKKHTIL